MELRMVIFQVFIKGLHVHLCCALGRSHHVGGVYRLIRGDEYKLFYLIESRQVCHILGTKHIGMDGLLWVVLHQGHVLVGRCMENELRTVVLKNLIQSLAIAYIGQDRLDCNTWVAFLKLLLDVK